MKDNCIFCKIVKGEMKADIRKETDDFIIFPDIKPMAETHLLIVSKNHISDFSLASEDLLIQARKVALELQKELNLEGFQFRVNWGNLLEVNHLHFHLLSGLKW